MLIFCGTVELLLNTWGRTDIYKIIILHCFVDVYVCTCTLHATYFPHFFPLRCLIQGLSSVSVTQYQWPCSLIALTGPGLTRRDRLSHVAGDALLACCLSLHLFGVSWMQPDKRLRRSRGCPFPQRDTRCRSSRTLRSLQLLRSVYSTRWCRAAFARCDKGEWAHRCGLFLFSCWFVLYNHTKQTAIIQIKGETVIVL